MNPLTSIWINGVPAEKIAVLDRGLQYGDGFFTTVLLKKGALLNWDAHCQRLLESAERLRFPALDLVELQRTLAKQYQSMHSPLDCMVVKIIMTRGLGGRGYQPPEMVALQLITQFMPAPELSDKTIAVEFSLVLLSVEPELAGIKHLNRLHNVLARDQLSAGVTEALMVNALGQVVCGTQSNLFLIQENQLITPSVALSGVSGTARRLLLKTAENCGLQVVEKPLFLADLLQADVLFMANAVRGIQPVSSLDLRNCSILNHKLKSLGISSSKGLENLPERLTLDFAECSAVISAETSVPQQALKMLTTAFYQAQIDNALSL